MTPDPPEHLVIRALRELRESKLSSKERKSMGAGSFVFPERRAYPIHDEGHARAALARVAQHGTPAEKARVRAAVKARYPKLVKG